jgi:hypothetical protein
LDESDLSPAQGLEMQRGIRFKKRHFVALWDWYLDLIAFSKRESG